MRKAKRKKHIKKNRIAASLVLCTHAFFHSVVPLDEICLFSLGLMKQPGKIMMSTNPIFLDSAPLSSISDYAFMTSNLKTSPV